MGGKIKKKVKKSIPKRRKCDPKTEYEKEVRKNTKKASNINLSKLGTGRALKFRARM